MDVALLIFIIFWCILALLALVASPKRSFPSLVAIGAAFYLAVKTKSPEALWSIIASFLLWLMAAILSIRRRLIGITRKDVEDAGALYSLPYLAFSSVLLVPKPEIGALALLVWLPLWYLLKRTYSTHELICLFVLYLPSLLLAVLYRTPLALTYAVPTLWLQLEIEEISKNWYQTS
jgi:hypothetical protein